MLSPVLDTEKYLDKKVINSYRDVCMNIKMYRCFMNALHIRRGGGSYGP